MNNFFSKKMARTSCIVVNVILLLVHVCFFTFFTFFGIEYMKIFNIFSILFYLLGFLLIIHEQLGRYFTLMSLEVMLHMVFACICLGCGYDFQLCLLGMVAVYFYGDYFSIQLQGKRVHGVFLGILSMALFVFVYARERMYEPLYVINDDIQFIFRISMIVINFVLVIVCMKLLTRYVIASEGALLKKADYDALTKMPNRYYMIDRIDHLYEDGQIENYWLAIMDIDDFKKINDRYGHNFGDYVLIKVAELFGSIKCVDACRWGGEEFLLLGKLDDTGNIPMDLLEQIRSDIEAMHLEQDEIQTSITMTIGSAKYRENLAVKDWIQIADKCLYVGKYNGKNQVVTEEA